MTGTGLTAECTAEAATCEFNSMRCVALSPGHVQYQSAHASVYDGLLAWFKVVDLCDRPTDMGLDVTDCDSNYSEST